MDIKESLRRILEQKQAVTHRFFTIALTGRHEGRLVFGGADRAGQSAEFSTSPQEDVYHDTWSYSVEGLIRNSPGSQYGKLGLPLAIYAQFTNDLLRTLREFHGADWDPELMEKWTAAIERVGQAIFAGYQ
jgi:hypothetical protein